MKKKLQIPKGFKPYKTIEGKFAAYIGPYFLKRKFPNTIFGTYIENYQSNLNEVAHGGFLMAYADSVGGFFAYNTVKKGIVTINLNSQFIRPVPVGSWLEAIGEVKKYGKRLVFVNVDMYIKKQLVFSSTGTWQIINIDKQ
ncbi:PaaI family thioesterase [Alphaproteobacteria bacterium]|nr:PaaI family thioesterase [Alphaproteobacteria bacterium]|tara:strand:+ start:214 stop:636 length:423 start_codon:yes stop_codon:yes gene_type:complete